MNVQRNSRFAETCREDPLDFDDAEYRVSLQSLEDVSLLACETDLYIGVFFDGTNNNKYRDAPGYGHSNVARLYEVFPGTPAGQTSPTLQPRMDASIDGATGKAKLVGVDRNIGTFVYGMNDDKCKDALGKRTPRKEAL